MAPCTRPDLEAYQFLFGRRKAPFDDAPTHILNRLFRIMSGMSDMSTATPRKNARMGFAPAQNRVVVAMRSVSNQIITTQYGRTLNFHLDCEYPKAGEEDRDSVDRYDLQD